MLYKVLGLILAVIGLMILKFFPDNYNSDFNSSGMLISGILLVSGIALLIFG